MRLKTILTMSGMTLEEKVLRFKDWLAGTIAARLPLRVRYWAVLQGIGYATLEHPNVPAADVEYILKHIEHPEVVR